MNMREMVLNHASVLVPNASRDEVTDWLRDLAAGMGRLVAGKVVRIGLRSRGHMHETFCSPGYSLYQAYQDLRRSGYREEYRFLVGLSIKAPLLHDVEECLEGRFRACEERTLPPGDGEPLVLCAIADWIAIGFPSAPIWDRDRITVRFNELLPDGTIEEASEEIDQLTRPAHAGSISDRHRERLLTGSDPGTLWENRETVFPHLVFGPDVEGNLKDQAYLFSTIVGKLKDLDRSAREWRDVDDRAPPWKTKVTPESTVKMKNRSFREARRFRSHGGTRETFEWHARFGDGGRIHLRFGPDSRKVEIGYIGPHLPL